MRHDKRAQLVVEVASGKVSHPLPDDDDGKLMVIERLVGIMPVEATWYVEPSA